MGGVVASGEGESALQTTIDSIEQGSKDLERKLSPLTNFIILGKDYVCHLCIARTVCRRCERAAVRAGYGPEKGREVLVFLNRLSDYLFVAARFLDEVN